MAIGLLFPREAVSGLCHPRRQAWAVIPRYQTGREALHVTGREGNSLSNKEVRLICMQENCWRPEVSTGARTFASSPKCRKSIACCRLRWVNRSQPSLADLLRISNLGEVWPPDCHCSTMTVITLLIGDQQLVGILHCMHCMQSIQLLGKHLTHSPLEVQPCPCCK